MNCKTTVAANLARDRTEGTKLDLGRSLRIEKSSVAAVGMCLGLALSTGTVHAQDSVQIYGIVTAGVGFIDKAVVSASARTTGKRIGLDSGQYTQSRFGFRGSEDLSGGLKASFVLEGGFLLDTGGSTQNALFGRRTTLGLSGGFGDLQIGRRKDFIDEIAADYSSQVPLLPFTGKVHGNNLDRSTGERANNMVFYTSPNMGGLRLNASYAFGETNGSLSTGQSLGAGGNYKSGGFGAGFGYWQSKLGSVTAAANSSSDAGAVSNAGCNTVGLGKPGQICTKTWMVGSSYDFGGLKLRGTYSQATQPLVTATGPSAPNFSTTFASAAGTGLFSAGGINNRKVGVVDVGTDYSLTDNWTLKASFIRSTFKFVGAAEDGQLTVLAAGADYSFSKRTLVYAMVGNMEASHMYSPGITGNGAPGVDHGQLAIAAGFLQRF